MVSEAIAFLMVRAGPGGVAIERVNRRFHELAAAFRADHQPGLDGSSSINWAICTAPFSKPKHAFETS